MKSFLLYSAIIILWMLGGQINKSFRRFFLPISLLLIKRSKSKKLLPIFSTFLTTSIGYGENSLIMKISKGNETLVRFIYSSVLIFPFAFFSDSWTDILSFLFVVVAFQIRSGGFKIYKYDFLWEDFFRATAFAFMVISL